MAKSCAKTTKNNINDDIIRKAAEVGARVALEQIDKERERQRVDAQKRRLEATEDILKKYPMWRLMAENAIFDARAIDEDAAQILDLLLRTDKETVKIESIQESAIRTATIVQHVRRMAAVYEAYCVSSVRPEEVRKYRALFNRYLAEQPMTVADIARDENVSPESIYNDLKESKEMFSALLFGIC
jgi:hypothetical protein